MTDFCADNAASSTKSQCHLENYGLSCMVYVLLLRDGPFNIQGWSGWGFFFQTNYALKQENVKESNTLFKVEKVFRQKQNSCVYK